MTCFARLYLIVYTSTIHSLYIYYCRYDIVHKTGGQWYNFHRSKYTTKDSVIMKNSVLRKMLDALYSVKDRHHQHVDTLINK